MLEQKLHYNYHHPNNQVSFQEVDFDQDTIHFSQRKFPITHENKLKYTLMIMMGKEE